MGDGERQDVFSSEDVERILGGELGAVVEAAVLSVARSRLDGDDLVAEVRSELAVKMLTGRFGGHDPRRGSFRTYLAAAARNGARDLLRRRTSLASLDAVSGDDPVEDRRRSPAEPDEILLEEEEREAFRRAFEALASRDPVAAAILEARHLEGLPFGEIAKRLGMRSIGALHLRAHRARKALGRLLRNPAPSRN